MHFRFRLRSERPLGVIFMLTFLTQLGYAVITPFLALYFSRYVPVGVVGLIFAGTYGLNILANIFSAKIIERISERKSLVYALGGAAGAIAFVGFAGHVIGIVILFALYTFLLTVALYNIDLYIKQYSAADSLAGNEGKLGMFGNLGWLVGPFIGSALAVQFGLPAVFIASAAATVAALILFVEARPHDRDLVKPSAGSFGQAVRNYFRDPELVKLYIISFGLSFFYGAWNFAPILLAGRGLSLGDVGIVYGLSALPWVLFEYPVGRLADRRFGERIFIVIGFALMAAATITFGGSRTAAWVIGALFVGIIGSSLIERTHAAKFYRQASAADVEQISVWRTSTGLGFIIAPLLAAWVLSLASLEFYFSMVGLAGLLFLAAALSLGRRR